MLSDELASHQKKGSKQRLKDLFLSSSHKDVSRSSTNSTGSTENPSNFSNHRSFLKTRGGHSGASLSSLSTQSSGGRKSDHDGSAEHYANSSYTASNITSSPVVSHTSGRSDDNVELNSSVQETDSDSKNKSKDSLSTAEYSQYSSDKKQEDVSGSKEKLGNRHHHSHLSLKRFLKKIKHKDVHSPIKPKNHSILPLHSSSDVFQKYGPVGKLLGSGASGSVNLVTLKGDPTKIFAIKKFRSKLPNESERDYKTKVTNEYKIGEYLKHQNLIHTYELIKEGYGKPFSEHEYYIIMEYCPYDFFNLVMSGLMDQNEINCYFKQIINGVAFLHQNGLAHRDLKLDNCVVDSNGILKLIDFGSAVQYMKDLTENTRKEDIIDDKHRLVRAKGIVGSDPYLAYEVFQLTNFGYDPRLVDVWSIAIIYCCMVLRRFPWKIPKASDPSFKSFAELPDPKSENELKPANKGANDLKTGVPNGDTHHGSTKRNGSRPNRGPDRLLYLLPEESRSMIKSMLTLDPNSRPFAPELLKYDFYNSIDYCHYDNHDINNRECFKATNHQHHLITEEELQKINAEKERTKKLKQAGVA
ncbi:uncharacterized protein PRCAT00004797001 [Priceomyces carsonii]|uniref:uncharacterized protein n=1 Tax=Priceomyces carsonii TaxID=28549 RepID=UPI002ED8E8C3|nr:unnamed protein product [Priceomyces carsonii]